MSASISEFTNSSSLLIPSLSYKSFLSCFSWFICSCTAFVFSAITLLTFSFNAAISFPISSALYKSSIPAYSFLLTILASSVLSLFRFPCTLLSTFFSTCIGSFLKVLIINSGSFIVWSMKSTTNLPSASVIGSPLFISSITAIIGSASFFISIIASNVALSISIFFIFSAVASTFASPSLNSCTPLSVVNLSSALI